MKPDHTATAYTLYLAVQWATDHPRKPWSELPDWKQTLLLQRAAVFMSLAHLPMP